MLSVKNEVVRVAPLARVNAVFPGWTESPMTRGVVDQEQVRRVSRTMALRKVAQPEDVARQIVVLASDELSGPRDGPGRHGRRRHGRPHRPRRLSREIEPAASPDRTAADDDLDRRRANCR